MKTKLLLVSLMMAAGLASAQPHNRPIQNHQGGHNGQAILGAAIILGTIGIIANSQRQAEPQVIIVPSPQAVPMPRYAPPAYYPQPPLYDYRTRSFRYVPAPKWDPSFSGWREQEPMYIPEEKHYPGCNFYDRDQAWDCIRYNDQLRGR